MEFQNLKFEKVDSVGIITLNRPKRTMPCQNLYSMK